MKLKSLIKPAASAYLLSYIFLPPWAAAAPTEDLPTVTVTAEFRETRLEDLPASATVISERVITQRAAQHLEQLLALAPNVNFSSGSSRARYFQIRGIGERSQFKEPINPSVGVIIDDMDFSGIGTAGMLFDVAQVEILRGAQGTRFGANALAGLIYIQARQPTETFTRYIETGAAQYGTWNLGGVISGPLSDTLSYRVASQRHSADGYIDNRFLGRDDTNNLDESTTRAKLRWLASDGLTLEFNAFYADIDNGYDAFSLDNTRQTLSDQPGHDRQESGAIAVKSTWQASAALTVESVLSYTDSNLAYGYDEDWSFVGLCDVSTCAADAYSSFDNYIRDRDNQTLEVRFLSSESGRIFAGTTDWVAGFYLKSEDQALQREYTFLAADFFSDYKTQNRAVFAELTAALTDKLALTLGARVEQWQADYDDTNSLRIDTDETLFGGKLVFDYSLPGNTLVYGSVSRGYKAGGVNTDGSLEPGNRAFDTEYQWAYELGLKTAWLQESLRARFALFYTDRRDQQVKGSILVPRDDNSVAFIDYIDNAARGNNYGFEVESVWFVSPAVQLSASLGLLETEFEHYINESGEDLAGRDQAQAPNYQYAVGLRYDFADGWYVSAGVEGKDGFYFSDRHNAKAGAYDLFNARVGFETDAWTVALWGRNLTDKDYFVRGFGSFGNDPRDGYAVKPYTQFGEPRVLGVTARWTF